MSDEATLARIGEIEGVMSSDRRAYNSDAGMQAELRGLYSKRDGWATGNGTVDVALASRDHVTNPKGSAAEIIATAEAMMKTDRRQYNKLTDLQQKYREALAERDGIEVGDDKQQGPSDKKSAEPAAVGPVAEGAEYFPGLSNAEVAEAVGAFAGLPDVIQNCLAWAATTEQPKFSAATPQHMDNFLALNDGAKDVMRKWGSSAKLKVGAFDARLTPWFQSMSATERKGLRDYFKRMPAAEFASVITKTLGR